MGPADAVRAPTTPRSSSGSEARPESPLSKAASLQQAQKGQAPSEDQGVPATSKRSACAAGHHRPALSVGPRGALAGDSPKPVAGGYTAVSVLEPPFVHAPGFFDLVADADGVPHRFVRLFRNGDKLGDDALEAKLATDDELEIIAAIAGG